MESARQGQRDDLDTIHRDSKYIWHEKKKEEAQQK